MQSSTYGTNTAWNTCTLNTSKKKLLIKKNTKYSQLQPGQEFISTTHL